MQPAFEFPVVTEDLKKVLEIGKLANYQWQSLSHVEISILIQTWQQKNSFSACHVQNFQKRNKAIQPSVSALPQQNLELYLVPPKPVLPSPF